MVPRRKGPGAALRIPDEAGRAGPPTYGIVAAYDTGLRLPWRAGYRLVVSDETSPLTLTGRQVGWEAMRHRRCLAIPLNAVMLEAPSSPENDADVAIIVAALRRMAARQQE